jgi:Gpi18-like mannosyltransferase
MLHGKDPYGALPPVSGLSFANIYSGQENPTIGYLPFWPIITALIYLTYSSMSFGNRFVYYFLLKQPIIAGDLALAYLLYSYISSRSGEKAVSKWALCFWLFSPFTIILSGIWGMFDSLAMSFLVLSTMTVVYAKRDILTGLGIFTKSLAVLYALPMTVGKGRNWWHVLLVFSLPALLSLLMIVGMGWSVSNATEDLASTVGKGGALGSMSVWNVLAYLFYLGIHPPISQFAYRVLGLIWIPAVIVFTVLAYRKLGFETDYGLIESMLVVTLAFLIFKARVTEQYSIYLLALSVLDVALWNPRRKRLLIATLATALTYLILNNYFLVRFLSPVYPDWVKFEAGLSPIEPVRIALLLVFGTVFTCLNVAYLVSILNGKVAVGPRKIPASIT